MSDYNNQIKSITERYNPDALNEVKTKTFSTIKGIGRDLEKYIMLAMNEVDDLYTQKTKEAGTNAKSHLQNELKQAVDFKYQGSVMTNTHIRGASDIDLLTIASNFSNTDYDKALEYIKIHHDAHSPEATRVRNWVNNFREYQGDLYEDLKLLRMDDERVLRNNYVICDTSRPKSIKIKNQNLHRDVDVVVATWFISLDNIKTDDDTYKGINIYDKGNSTLCKPDYPFLSIDRINKRSTATFGRLKKMIRFLKNVKTDSISDIDLSSYEINAICYGIDPQLYVRSHYLELVDVLRNELLSLSVDEGKAQSLKSVDGMEYIFRDSPARMEGVLMLYSEVNKIYKELKGY